MNEHDDAIQKRLSKAVAEAWLTTSRVESEARILSNLAWAAEEIMTNPNPTWTRNMLVDRIGDLLQVIRERALALSERCSQAPE
ncbi:MAG: hypothetical protein U1E66_08720 [Rhodospirillales bacterium]